MTLLLWIISIYPLYKTGECIRSWNRVTKQHFQQWLIFWYVFWIVNVMRCILEVIWIINVVLPLYDGITALLLLGCYNIVIATHLRRLVILPAIREIKKYITPYMGYLRINPDLLNIIKPS